MPPQRGSSPMDLAARAGGPRPPVAPSPTAFGRALALELTGSRRAVLAAAAVTVVGLTLLLGGRASSGAAPAAAGAPPVPGPPHHPAPPEPAPPPATAPPPAERYAALAEEAAATCPGLPPGVLYAIAETETRHGRDTGVSSAGAVGPMQFLPATWRAYATDGNGDGRLDIESPADAVHSAARHLCANGGADPGGLRDAIWNYNHSHAYVEWVLRAARTYAAAR